MSKFCTDCGAQIPDEAKFCQRCGKRQDVNVAVKQSVLEDVSVETAKIDEVEKPTFANSENKRYSGILKNKNAFINRCLIAVLALITFALSFASFRSYSFNNGKYDVTVSYTAVDGVVFMFDSFMMLSDDDLMDSDLYYEVEELTEELSEEMDADGITLHGERILNKLQKRAVRLSLQSNDVETNAVIIVMGILSLCYILLTISFSVFAVLNLFNVKWNKIAYTLAVTVFAFAIILHSAYSLMFDVLGLFINGITSAVSTKGYMGGGALATIIISLIVFAVIALTSYIFRQHEQKFNAIPRLIATVLSVLVIALSFSSVYSVDVKTVFNGRSSQKEVSIDVNGNVFTQFTMSSYDDLIEDVRGYTRLAKKEFFENLFASYGDYSVREVENGSADALTLNIIYLLAASKLTDEVSIVFSFVPLLFLLGLIFASMVLSQNLLYFMLGSYNESFVKTSKILSLVFASLGFIASVIFLIVLNTFVSSYMPRGFTVSISAGVIFLLVFAISNVICPTGIKNENK